MRAFSLFSVLRLSLFLGFGLFLAGCETTGHGQSPVTASVAEEAKPLRSTPVQAQEAGVDCNQVPRTSGQIAIYREHCL